MAGVRWAVLLLSLALASTGCDLPGGDAPAGEAKPPPAAATDDGARLSADVADPRARPLRLWAPTNMSDFHQYTEQEAVSLARRADVVTAIPSAFRGHVPAMKRANPDLELLVYVNGTLVSPARASEYPEDWFAMDADGQRITSNAFGNVLMDISHPGWRGAVPGLCTWALERSGMDRCYVDMLTDAPLNDGYVRSTPIHPRTGQPWNRRAYIEELLVVAGEVERAHPGTAGNGVLHGARYFDPSVPTRSLASVLSAVHAEDFLRTGDSPVEQYPSVEVWEQNVAMIEDIESLGSTAMATTKVWVDATEDEIDSWYRYAVASFLLATDGTGSFGFTGARTKAGVDPANNPDVGLASLGTPMKARRALPNGLHIRDFAHGKVAVNPSGRPLTLTLEHPHRVEQEVVRDQLVLQPRSGVVMLYDGGPHLP